MLPRQESKLIFLFFARILGETAPAAETGFAEKLSKISGISHFADIFKKSDFIKTVWIFKNIVILQMIRPLTGESVFDSLTSKRFDE